MSGSNPNKFKFVLYAAPIDPSTGKTVSGLRRKVGLFRTYDKAGIALEKEYMKETQGEETFWIANRLRTKQRKT